ncbi:MAG: ATP-binding cassette domain-containing protein [Sediminibacterium sp.]|nr:ATP-binding cassette domain-containing protein [Sediminibacterium sp.]
MSFIVQAITKKYDQFQAVESLSFTIQPGEIVGFLGPNGAGKSTTLKMIAGFLSPDTGSIQLSGIDLQQNEVAYKKKIGYLPESNPLYDDLYVLEYLNFLAQVHSIPFTGKRIQEVISQTGLQSMQHKKIGFLSKGYKQRVGIAAAILHQPELILLDEPTSGLDPNQLIEIRSLIQSLSASAMILFSSHILQEVAAIADRVLVLHQGKLVANQPMEELTQSSQHNLLVQFQEDMTAYLPLIQLKYKLLEQQDKRALVIQAKDAVVLDQARQYMMALALEKGLHIERLQTQEASLEEIFKLLTH